MDIDSVVTAHLRPIADRLSTELEAMGVHLDDTAGQAVAIALADAYLAGRKDGARAAVADADAKLREMGIDVNLSFGGDAPGETGGAPDDRG